jgi:hypothetical protein
MHPISILSHLYLPYLILHTRVVRNELSGLTCRLHLAPLETERSNATFQQSEQSSSTQYTIGSFPSLVRKCDYDLTCSRTQKSHINFRLILLVQVD